MKVIILGAGVIGVATAYFLAKKGHDVTVIERHKKLAMESSFANGAQLSYSHCEPWATFGNLAKALKWLGHKEAPLLLRLRWDPDMYKWLTRFIINALPHNVDRNTLNIVRLSFYSRKVLNELLPELKFQFDFAPSGILHLFTKEEDLIKAVKHFNYERNYEDEVLFQVLDKKQCLAKEPAAANLIESKMGGIYFPQDAIGDVYQFTLGLAAQAKELGVKFILENEVSTLTTSGIRITGVDSQKGFYSADNFVVCLGAYTPLLLRPIGINLPIYPMKGYSVTIPVKQKHQQLKMSITDQQRKIVYTPMENCLRAAGTVELTGYCHDISPERIAPIAKAAQEAFPNGGDFKKIQSWACLRPQTPQSTPLLGRSKYSNLYINSGHGSLGWTQALGSSQLVADIVDGKKPEININGLGL
jgi:D-amino-acid dehydrogenase